MSDFHLHSDSVDVEQIMEQIRERIRSKRGVDYTEQQIHEMAAAKLEKFLDPRSVRSDLLEQFRRRQPVHRPPEMPNYAFEEDTLFESHRAPVRWIRRLLQPVLKLFFNPNPLVQALNIQSRLNRAYEERETSRLGFDQLFYEVIHNLVVELTRTGIEVKNLKMRVESLTSRLEFAERRERALEAVVLYKSSPDDQAVAPEPIAAGEASHADTSGGAVAVREGPGQRSRRRRRRRGRRGGASAAAIMEGHAADGAGDASLKTNPVDDSPGAPPASQGVDRSEDARADLAEGGDEGAPLEIGEQAGTDAGSPDERPDGSPPSDEETR